MAVAANAQREDELRLRPAPVMAVGGGEVY